MTTKKIHRFIGKYQLAPGMLRIDDAELAHQMRSVLKLETGESVILGDGTGQEAQCRIVSYDRDAVILDCFAMGRNGAELPIRTVLYCAVLKADHFELTAAKAAEIGISEIVPILTGRTVKLNLRLDRVEKIVRESAELAGRGVVPLVRPITDFDAAVSDARGNDQNIFFDPSGTAFSGVPKSARRVGIFVGPEGGWEDSEVDTARSLGMTVASLGSLVLRAETAAIVASYVVAHQLKS